MPEESTAKLEDVIVSCGRPSGPQLSPDGRWVLWEVSPYGIEGDYPEGAIWTAPVDGSRPAAQLTAGSGQDAMPWWSPDGSHVAFVSDRASRGSTGLYLMPFSGGEARCLIQRKSSIDAFAWSPDGQTIAFLSADEPSAEDERREKERDDPRVFAEKWPYSRLHLVDVESGEVRSLPSGDRHLFEVVWSPDGSRIAFFARPTPELESRKDTAVYTITEGDREPLLVCPAPGWIVSNLVWSGDGRHLAFLAGHDATVAAVTVYSVDAAGGESRVIGPGASESVCAAGLRTVTGDNHLATAIASGLSTHLELIHPGTGARAMLYQPEQGDIAGLFDVRLSNDRIPVLAVVGSSGDQPPELHAGSPDKLTKISDHHWPLRHFTFGRQEPFYWTGQDGLELDGVLIRPVAGGDGPHPMVVHIHGGPYGRYGIGWNLAPGNWAQWLAVHGYAVLMPNYRGGMGHGNAFAKWAHAGVGDQEFDDIMTCVDAAIERGIADADRLGIGGWSQGGFMTAWAVTQTNRFKAGVIGAGVTDWNMMVMTSDIPTIEANLGGSRPWDGPGPHRGTRHSPISYARNVETPVLILHGEDDARVPVSQAIGFHRALMETHTPNELVIYPREPHGIRERNHQRDLLCRVRDWFQRWV